MLQPFPAGKMGYHYSSTYGKEPPGTRRLHLLRLRDPQLLPMALTPHPHPWPGPSHTAWWIWSQTGAGDTVDTLDRPPLSSPLLYWERFPCPQFLP